MHPAPSVVIFTTLSGLGFGLLAWLGLGLPAVAGIVAFIFFAIAFGLAVGGLMASTFHLGHPERALKAFTQWRSSWLSREGVLAVAALLVMAVYGFGVVFLSVQWTLLGWIGSLLSALTVFATSMIYAQLKTVPRWNLPLTPALFMSFAIGGGALLAGQIKVATVFLIVAGIVQVAYWIVGDRALLGSGSTLSTATGLRFGAVRAFEPPHTGTNYLLKEFAYVVGRRHSMKLRVIGLTLMAVVPVLCLLLPFSHVLAAVAVLSHLVGVAVVRWLFFAEAEHVVGLYYGVR